MIRIKYHNDIGLGELLSSILANFVAGFAWPIDLIVPVPLGKSRFRARGYNQAAVIGWPLALALGWPYASDGVSRVRETASQVGLSRSERRENVRGAFVASPARVSGRTILLVDDVVTTGSTVSSVAQALRAAGAAAVYALTAARAVPGDNLNDV